KLRPLRNSEVAAIQMQLSKSGYYSDAIDGRLGTVTRRAIGQYQRRAGLTVDCWPSQDLLASLRGAAPN
ncbi:peptidoglycan-binding domain-containing protein, partial [Bradyrhizobium sp. UFLA05-109]